ncbi:unnamed protein product [Camellia sinensis]
MAFLGIAYGTVSSSLDHERKGYLLEQQESIYTHAPPSVTSSDTTESQSPALQHTAERCNDSWHLQPRKGGEQGDENITKKVLESLPDQEEEVIGIWKMKKYWMKLMNMLMFTIISIYKTNSLHFPCYIYTKFSIHSHLSILISGLKENILEAEKTRKMLDKLKNASWDC